MSARAVLARSGSAAHPWRERDLTLLELLARLLEGAVAIHGEVTLPVADVDLVRVGLRLVAASVESLEQGGGERPPEIGG